MAYDYRAVPSSRTSPQPSVMNWRSPTHASTILYLPGLLRHHQPGALSTGRREGGFDFVVQDRKHRPFLDHGCRAQGEAASRLDRRVVVLASGGMSHTFWPLKQLPKHEASTRFSHHRP